MSDQDFVQSMQRFQQDWQRRKAQGEQLAAGPGNDEDDEDDGDEEEQQQDWDEQRRKQPKSKYPE